jgi:hypothetical protein
MRLQRFVAGAEFDSATLNQTMSVAETPRRVRAGAGAVLDSQGLGRHIFARGCDATDFFVEAADARSNPRVIGSRSPLARCFPDRPLASVATRRLWWPSRLPKASVRGPDEISPGFAEAPTAGEETRRV